MTAVTPSATLVSLPVELRLQIATYVLEQPANAGLVKKAVYVATIREGVRPKSNYGLWLDSSYSAASNLSILLVCRQFHDDFRRLAFERTRFLLTADPATVIAHQSDDVLRNLRKLAIQCGSDTLLSWQKFPFNREVLKLDELIITLDLVPHGQELPRMLRRLENVKVVKFVAQDQGNFKRRVDFNCVLGVILREDHYQRYDAPNAPSLETTWWEWSYSASDKIFTLVAKPPRPIMPETEYMELAEPKVHELMTNMMIWTAPLLYDQSDSE